MSQVPLMTIRQWAENTRKQGVPLPRMYAEEGEKYGAEIYLRVLAYFLRNNPSPEEREEVAALLESVADAGAEGAAAVLYLMHPHRPKESLRAFAIYKEVRELVDKGEHKIDAYRRVAQRYGLSVSRVKEACGTFFLADRQKKG